MHSFEAEWRSFYPNYAPLGFMMRSASAEHWVRFHSLPNSKRYAQTDAEGQIILDRQNGLADEVLGAGTRCWLVQTAGVPPDDAVNLKTESLWRRYEFEFAFRFLIKDGDDYETDWESRASQQTWKASAFDDLLLAIADDDAEAIGARVLWMSRATGAVFAPYDGGVDLFLPTHASVQHLKTKYKDWLSLHPSGL
jgi:hypothetical protein